MRQQRHSRPKTALALGASLAAFVVGMTGSAFAQDVQEEEEIVVTGFRASLAQAIDIKRNETAAVDAIVAEDIADFPDLNLSESIQRIPGVAITRSNGEGRQITVRGLGPQFTRVRLNGMEAMSAVGSTDAEGGTNRGRNFDFNVFASELFNSITVRKTASAETEEGSLGATVDLRTARPFDYDGFELATSLQWGYSDLSGNYDPRIAFLASNTWGDWGALLSFAFSDRNSIEEGASTVRWQSGGAVNACGSSCFGNVLGQTAGNAAGTRPDFDAVNAAFHPRLPRYDVYEHTQDRLGATFALQWQPSNSTDLTLDILYAEHDVTRSESFLQAPVFSTNGGAGIGGVEVLDYAIDGNSLVYGEFDNVDIRSENRYDQATSGLTQVSLALGHEFSESLRLNAFIGRSEAEHDNPVQTTLLWDRNNIDGYIFDFRGNDRLPLISYGGEAVDDPDFWTLSQIRLRPQFVDNSYDTIYADLAYDATPWLTLSGGVNWRQYEFVSRELRRSNGTTSNQEGVLPGFVVATDNNDYFQIVTIDGGHFDLPGGLTTSWAAPDVIRAGNLWNLGDSSVFPVGIEPALGNNFTVTEEDRGAYLQADWDTMIGNMPFRGNFGVRYVETDQTSTGFTPSGGLPVFQSVERSYSDTLPALNLVFEPMDDLLIRFAAADVMTRPNLGQLNPGSTVTGSSTIKTVTAGNPTLDPFRARSYDFAIEWYFRPEALLSIAFFYKDIDSFVQTVRETGPFTGNSLGLDDSIAIAACGGFFPASCAPDDTDWQFSQPRNTPGGPVQGYEISFQTPFFFLPGIWSNFGVAANYTHVESEIDYVDSNGVVVVTDDLTGLSGESWNATLYYEGERLSARVSGAYRSEYLTTIPGRNSNTSESTAETMNVDFASSFRVSDRVTLTLEGLNLTDEVTDQFLSPDDRVSFYHYYGRQWLAGVRFRY